MTACQVQPVTSPDIAASDVMPRQIILHQLSQVLDLVWSDIDQVRLTATELRSACRCSACQAGNSVSRSADNSARNSASVHGLIQSTVAITEVRRFGVAGIQCVFSDGHERGVYPWSYLKSLGAERGDKPRSA